MSNINDSEVINGEPQDEEGSDELRFSEDTMKALLEFYKEQEERDQKLQAIADGDIPEKFDENWNMSQFWYTEETSNSLAAECIKQLDESEEIACLSCPTLYRTLRKTSDTLKKTLLEFDTRFAVYRDDFVFYDYRNPLGVPKHFREKFSLVVADPPYLSDDCLTKTAITIKYIAKPDARIILCTGSKMEETATKLLKVSKCKFPIKHNKGLSNPFSCYANYDLDASCKEKG